MARLCGLRSWSMLEQGHPAAYLLPAPHPPPPLLAPNYPVGGGFSGRVHVDHPWPPAFFKGKTALASLAACAHLPPLPPPCNPPPPPPRTKTCKLSGAHDASLYASLSNPPKRRAVVAVPTSSPSSPSSAQVFAMGVSVLFVTKILASLSALYMCLSPSTAIYRIHKERQTGLASIVPLVSLWGCNHTWFLYGFVSNDIFPLMVTYLVGDILSMIFIAVYYRWSTEKTRTFKMIAIALVLNIVITLYSLLGMSGVTHQSADSVKFNVGCAAIASSVMLYASPFATISHVVKTKSSASIPVTMVAVGTVNNILWVAYGFMGHDIMMIIPTSINIVIGVIHMSLYCIYHPKHQSAAIQADTVSIAIVAGPDNFHTQALPGVTILGDGSRTASSATEDEDNWPLADPNQPMAYSFCQLQSPSGDVACGVKHFRVDVVAV